MSGQVAAEFGSVRWAFRDTGPGAHRAIGRAIPDYLQIDRNSAHSFLKEVDPDQEPDNLTIFLSHTEMMPNKTSSLAFFRLLVHVADPDLLEND
jgi:hypothetical protein